MALKTSFMAKYVIRPLFTFGKKCLLHTRARLYIGVTEFVACSCA